MEVFTNIKAGWDCLKMPEEEKSEIGLSHFKEEDNVVNYYHEILDGYDKVDGRYNLPIQGKSLKIMDAQSSNKILKNEMNKTMIDVHNSNLLWKRILVIDFIMMVLCLTSIISSVIFVKLLIT